MRNVMLTAALFMTVPALLTLSCKKNEQDAPPEAPPAYGQPAPPGYAPQAPPGAPPPGYAQPVTPGQAPAAQAPLPGAAPAAPLPAQPAPAPAPAGLSQPGAMAFPCTSDANCLTHRCNTTVGKCAWPCQSNSDCMPGNQCIAPACVPMPGAQ